MENMDKFLGMLGLCARAGRLAAGEDGVRIAIKKKQAHLVIMDACSSENTKDWVGSLCGYTKTELITVDADIGRAIGKEGRRIIAVTDKVFAKNLRDLFNKNDSLANNAE